MSWIEDIFKPEERTWESFYRTRWAYDKKVRSTHGVNCTGSCSWDVYVKNGIVVWELQALDYPVIDRHIPPYEPRGCQRGISYSWYLYSPIRIKYPYIRGALLDLWRAAKKQYPADPVAAWASIVTDPQKRKEYHKARGKGGFRRISWDEASELIAAANIYTVKRYGPDRIIGFSPIPAMSMVSYAAGARFCQLMGGVSLSFYDWYCDLPPASPEIWGEQTDVAESADWFHSKFIACVGSNVLMTRTPDAHFLVEARHSGAKVVVFSPDFSQTSKVADEWIPLHQGSDGAFWMAVGHIILKEYYAERKVDSFIQYLRQYSDAPFLVVVEKQGNGKYYPGKLLRASQIESTRNIENAEWKFFVIDETSGEFKILKGNVGHRWQKRTGEWNLKLEDSLTGAPVVPLLEIKGREDTTVPVEIPDFSDGGNRRTFSRHIPVKRVRTVDGEVYVTTVMELYYAQYGVNRGFEGDYPRSYDDSEQPFTPGWQEKFTGVSAKTVINFAREWARTAEQTGGKCSVIIGAGVNHWYHNNLIYRAVINALIFCGCVGKNGGGWNHYVGQEKLAEKSRAIRYSFEDIATQPRRLLTTPCWSGITLGSRTYSAYCQNIEQLIPFRTLTGRQHLYIDHEAYIAFGENLPTFKPRAELRQTQDLDKSLNGKDGLVLNYLTPHGKWHIHSTYGDTLRMKTLSRGCWPVWINDKDAQIIGIEDNDWVEMYNDHGVVCTRAIVSARIPRGICLLYHSPERTVGVPKSPQRGMRRAGGHNSLTRVRLKPLFMVGGYGQFTYAFNYWGPQGVNRDTYVVVKKLTKVIY
ncbi:MAG: molybdopterin-dependent oxidoreductase [Verrucomicrobiia bacterium]